MKYLYNSELRVFQSENQTYSENDVLASIYTFYPQDMLIFASHKDTVNFLYNKFYPAFIHYIGQHITAEWVNPSINIDINLNQKYTINHSEDLVASIIKNGMAFPFFGPNSKSIFVGKHRWNSLLEAKINLEYLKFTIIDKCIFSILCPCINEEGQEVQITFKWVPLTCKTREIITFFDYLGMHFKYLTNFHKFTTSQIIYNDLLLCKNQYDFLLNIDFTEFNLPILELKDVFVPNFCKAYDYEISSGFVELIKELGFDYLETNGTWGYSNEFVTVSPGDTCIDCGSNVGLVSAWMVAKGASKVYAFEPAKNVYPWLLHTVRLHSNIIEPCNDALGAACDVLMFSQIHSMIGSHFYKYNVNSQVDLSEIYSVDVQTIDTMFKDKQIDFIKMDCEGAERDILLGAQEVIRRCSPKMVISYEHLSDDKEMLFKIIKAINPNYNIISNQFNFFCWVDKS